MSLEHRDADVPSYMTANEFRVLHRYVERLTRYRSEAIEVGILVRDSGMYQDPERSMRASWIEFSINGKKYGIWRSTLQVYEADEHGAMGDDPIALEG